jgi:exodeoxyribonuclease-3
MKIVIWNINGLRAGLRKGMWDWLAAENPDLICLQEIKARPDQLTPADHEKWAAYTTIWNPAARPGYSGVVTMALLPPEKSRKGLGHARFDDEGRVVRTDFPGLVLFNVYFPNGKRDHSRVPYKLDFYAQMLATVDELHAAGKSVVIGGDFNTAHQDIDLRHPRANRNTTGFLPEERAWIDRYLAHGMVDIFRERNPEREQYTWWTYRMNARARNVGWRLDYFLISEGLAPRVNEICIHDEVLGSDHCPVSIVLGI